MAKAIKPSVVRRNNGTYAARWPDENGAWRWAGGFQSEGEAAAYSVRMKLAVAGDVAVIRHDITFAELADIWLNSRIDLAENTIDAYAEHIRVRINPVFGNEQVRWLTYHHV